MADERPLVEQLLDVAIYAPIGAVLLASEQIPAFVAKGRARLEGQVAAARMLGRMAVATARSRVGETVASTWSRRGSPAEADLHGDVAGSPAGDGRAEADAPRSDPDGAAGDAPPAASGRGDGDGGRRVRAVPDVGSLAIPGYDALAASQVVQRLEGLSPEELATVRCYEEATRGRRTILGRITQLQGDSGTGG